MAFYKFLGPQSITILLPDISISFTTLEIYKKFIVLCMVTDQNKICTKHKIFATVNQTFPEPIVTRIPANNERGL